jgi:hypothetical protein
MIELLRDIETRLESRSYSNEAAVREGIVVPILRALGWNTFDPNEVRPEHPNPAGRVDYALMQRGARPAVLIEVKAVGRSLEGDRQLFGYCFEEGVPLAVLTDGSSWNFYLPAGVGRIDERRIYSLQLTDRSPEEAERVFNRYLARDRVLDRSAFEAARQDHEAALNSREAGAALPAAWAAVVEEQNDAVVESLRDKAEAICGFRPSVPKTLSFLQRLQEGGSATSPLPAAKKARPVHSTPPGPAQQASHQAPGRLAIEYTLFGEQRIAANASVALVDILRSIVAKNPAKIADLSDRVTTRTRRHVARTPEEVYPGRPSHARAEEIAPGWLVGLNINNRDKLMIIQEACALYGVSVPEQLDLKLPNS